MLAFAAGCGGSNGESAPTTTATATSGECTSVDAPKPRGPGANTAPSAPLDASKTYALVFETNCGSFTVTLDTELAPNTAASLVALAKAGYFDDTISIGS